MNNEVKFCWFYLQIVEGQFLIDEYGRLYLWKIQICVFEKNNK